VEKLYCVDKLEVIDKMSKNITAIILAAGRGTRLHKYTADLPKGMLLVNGKTIIERQIETYRRNGIHNIVVVRGYMADKIPYSDVKYFFNDRFATTNMVESLFVAETEFHGDVIISYADIIFEDRVLKLAIDDQRDISVLVDMDWHDYWKARYGRVDFDTESLTLGLDDTIVELGKSDPPIEEIDGRYVGMLRLSSNGVAAFRDLYFRAREQFAGKAWINNFEQAFMTDFLQALIANGQKIFACKTKRGWYEFDTNEDYEIFNKLVLDKSIGRFIEIA
jgi:L-glutamine-phosphate cytidylyltransferase